MESAERQSEVDLLRSSYQVVAAVPFSSTTKLSAVVVSRDGDHTVFVKGAPEIILKRCQFVLTADGFAEELTQDGRRLINDMIERQAKFGERVVSLAKLALNPHIYSPQFSFKLDPEPNFPLTGLTYIASICVSDPPRPTVKDSIEALRRAGIKVMMLTGDSHVTAQAIAAQVGILTPLYALPKAEYKANQEEGKCLFGKESLGSLSEGATVIHTLADFQQSSDTQRIESLNDQRGGYYHALIADGHDLELCTPLSWDYIFRHSEVIFSRTTPDHKLLIVKECQKRGFLVGVTGDGVNDSPALKYSSIGISFSNASEVAKDAASIVLLNNDFTSIVHAVEEGRLIFCNLRKVIAYAMAAGVWSELVPVVATFVIGLPQPLAPFLMIVISCLTDVYAGIALTREPPEENILLVPPRNLKTQPLVDIKLLLYSSLFYGTMELVGAFVLYCTYMSSRGRYHFGENIYPANFYPPDLIGAWTWGQSPNSQIAIEDMQNASRVASSVFFVALITAQWGHLISVRRRSPYFSDAIMNTNNSTDHIFKRIKDELLQSAPRIPIVAAIVASAVTAVIVNQVPGVQRYAGTGAVPAELWGYAICFSIAWFLVAEAYKWLHLAYPNNPIISIIAW